MPRGKGRNAKNRAVGMITMTRSTVTRAQAGTKESLLRERRLARTAKQSAAPGRERFLRTYPDLLDRPFFAEPVPLGFGALTNTIVSSTVIKGSYTTLSGYGYDTMFVAQPVIQAPLQISQTAAATDRLYSSGGYITAIANPQYTSIRQAFESVRPIAMGLRLMPLVAATSVPAVMYAGQFNVSSTDPYLNLSEGASSMPRQPVDVWESFQGFDMSVLQCGGTAVDLAWRPLDPTCFSFDNRWVENSFQQLAPVPGTTTPTNLPYLASFQQAGPMLVACIQGLPLNTTVAYELVIHYEAVPNLSSLLSAPAGQTTGASFFPSVDQLWSTVKDKLGPTVTNVASDIASASAARMFERISHHYRQPQTAQTLKTSNRSLLRASPLIPGGAAEVQAPDSKTTEPVQTEPRRSVQPSPDPLERRPPEMEISRDYESRGSRRLEQAPTPMETPELVPRPLESRSGGRWL